MVGPESDRTDAPEEVTTFDATRVRTGDASHVLPPPPLLAPLFVRHVTHTKQCNYRAHTNTNDVPETFPDESLEH